MSEHTEYNQIAAEVNDALTLTAGVHRSEIAPEDRTHAMGIGTLRRAADLTQTELAGHLGASDLALSYLRKRGDLLLYTLDSYVRSIGGRVRVVISFDGGHEATVDLSEMVRVRRSSAEVVQLSE